MIERVQIRRAEARDVPVRLGREGVEKIIELQLTPEELKQLQASASHVAESVSKLKL